jgi:hypothetical protein
VTEIDSEKALVLRCGQSSIRLTKDRIEITSPSVSVAGGGGGLSAADGELRITSKGDAVVKAQKVLLQTPDASLSMKTDVQVDGRKILLNSPDQATDPAPKKAPPLTTIELADQEGTPLVGQRYVIVFGDGSERAGVLDKDGKAEVEIEGNPKIHFPGLKRTKRG